MAALDRVQQSRAVPGHPTEARKAALIRDLTEKRDLLIRQLQILDEHAALTRAMPDQTSLIQRRTEIERSLNNERGISVRLQLEREREEVQARLNQLQKAPERMRQLEEEYRQLPEQLRAAPPTGSVSLAAVVLPCEQVVLPYLQESFCASIAATMRLLNTSKISDLGPNRFIYPHHRADRQNLFSLPASHWVPISPLSPAAPHESPSMSFRSRPGVRAADAIRSLFTSGTQVVIECLAALRLCYFKALLDLVGDVRFNQLFPNGVNLSNNSDECLLMLQPYWTMISLARPDEIQVGDWVYFHNDPRYLSRHAESFGNALQGENALYLGYGQYEGFGMGGTADKIVSDLRNAYNALPTRWDALQGRYVIDDERASRYPVLTPWDNIPGLFYPHLNLLQYQNRIYPVFRPNIAHLFP